ncbi:MAG: hypothetical protein L3J82_03355 [Planctomycetes bacterium]|nr:hypothetical protein [Planctomycetota bacterium]
MIILENSETLIGSENYILAVMRLAVRSMGFQPMGGEAATVTRIARHHRQDADATSTANPQRFYGIAVIRCNLVIEKQFGVGICMEDTA